MRVRLVTGDDRRVLDQLGRKVGVVIERDGDGQTGRDTAKPRYDLALRVVAILDHHRSVQIQQSRVASGAHGVLERSHEALECLARRLVRRPRFGCDRCHDTGTRTLGDIEICAHRRVRSCKPRAGRVAERRSVAVSERGKRCRQRRECVGLVLDERDDEAKHENGVRLNSRTDRLRRCKSGAQRLQAET